MCMWSLVQLVFDIRAVLLVDVVSLNPTYLEHQSQDTVYVFRVCVCDRPTAVASVFGV